MENMENIPWHHENIQYNKKSTMEIKNYNEKCRGMVFECVDHWKDMAEKIGRWIDFDNDYKTMSKEYMECVWNVFKRIYDKDYGFCYPVLNVLYERDYYKIKNARLTVDKKIIYKKFIDKNISNLYTNDSFNVAEIKQSSSKFSNIFNKNFPFDRSRFSKYCRGIEFTKYNYCNELF